MDNYQVQNAPWDSFDDDDDDDDDNDNLFMDRSIRPLKGLLIRFWAIWK